MPHITRRQLISGLAATTAAFSIGGCRESKQRESQQPQPKQGQAGTSKQATGAPVKLQLNVILHGLMAVGVVKTPSSPNEGIRLVFPDIPDGGPGSPAHLYLAGNVKDAIPGDTDLQPFDPGTNKLLGLLPGSLPDFSSQPATFFLPNIDKSLQLYEPGKRVITMPWPKAMGVASVKKMYVRPTPSSQCESPAPLISAPATDPLNGKLTSIFTIHIFTYDCDPNDAKGPRLTKPDGTDLKWTPQPVMLPPDCTLIPTANLHIFGEPQKKVASVNHLRHAFHELMATHKKGGGGDLSTDYNFKPFTIGYARLCPPDGNCRPGILPVDLRNLPVLHTGSEGGEVANCVQSIVNLG